MPRSYPLTDPRQFGILQSGPGSRGCVRGTRKGTQLFPARRFSAALTTSLLIAGGFLFSVADAQAQGASGACQDAAELAVLSSPIAPWKGTALRVVFVAEKPLEEIGRAHV